MRAMPRVPWGPWEEAVRIQAARDGRPAALISAASAATRADRRTVAAWRRTGVPVRGHVRGQDVYPADSLAALVGMTPRELWGRDWPEDEREEVVSDASHRANLEDLVMPGETRRLFALDSAA